MKRRWLALALLPASIVPFAAAAPHFLRDAPPTTIPTWRQPLTAPTARLDAGSIAAFRPPPTFRGAVPVIVYRGVSKVAKPGAITAEEFARHMAMLNAAGFHTVSLDQFVRWPGGSAKDLPSRPILITFDHGRLDSYRHADAALARYGFRATMFVSTSQVERRANFFLNWEDLRVMAASGRWDVQAHGSDALGTVPYDADGDRGPAYAYRRLADGTTESFDAWRVRVRGDIDHSVDLMRENLPGYTPLAFAVPYANYGQDASNDPRIAPDLDEYLHARFGAVFISGKPIRPPAGAQRTLRRLDVSVGVGADDLYRWLDTDPQTAVTATRRTPSGTTTKAHPPTTSRSN
jgi:poly-beta-1,6-N-acetyl-D-glucosamine N-deacetylase